jgi:hypothetical protein
MKYIPKNKVLYRRRRNREEVVFAAAHQILAEYLAERASDALPKHALFEQYVSEEGINFDFIDDVLAKVWAEKRDDYLREWIARWPGERPVFFYMYDRPDIELQPCDVESEAQTLRRHKALVRGEEKRVAPALFLPIKLPPSAVRTTQFPTKHPPSLVDDLTLMQEACEGAEPLDERRSRQPARHNPPRSKPKGETS